MFTHQTICVYAASSNAVADEFMAVATELGGQIARRHGTLIYGGGCTGLMGAVARGVHQHQGKVVGVIPHFMRHKEVAYEAADEMVVTEDMRSRKAILESRADAFVALPGGFGTLEEVLEVITLKLLKRHAKPVVLLNACGFYDPLIGMFEHVIAQRFAKPGSRDAYHVAGTVAELFDYLTHYPHSQVS